MDFTTCTQCGTVIESTGIQYRGRTFCRDECCEKFAAEHADWGEPDSDDLADERFVEEDFGEVDLDDDGLGYQDQDADTTVGFDDEDDFRIR